MRKVYRIEETGDFSAAELNVETSELSAASSFLSIAESSSTLITPAATWLDKDTTLNVAADLLEIGGMPEVANSVREVLKPTLKPVEEGEYYIYTGREDSRQGQPVKIVRPAYAGPDHARGWIQVAFASGGQLLLRRKNLSADPVRIERTESWSVAK